MTWVFKFSLPLKNKKQKNQRLEKYTKTYLPFGSKLSDSLFLCLLEDQYIIVH